MPHNSVNGLDILILILGMILDEFFFFYTTSENSYLLFFRADVILAVNLYLPALEMFLLIYRTKSDVLSLLYFDRNVPSNGNSSKRPYGRDS